MENRESLDTLCAALCYAMGIDAPACAAGANKTLCDYIDEKLAGQKADRIFMYNPDAVAQWIFEKYPHFVKEVNDRAQVQLPLRSVMPSVTPVCFGTMYTGAQPAVHGIQAYTKPVITIDTIFDALLRNGKKVAILCTAGDSLSKIYLERNIDYFFYDSIEKLNAKVSELIIKDEHDFIVLYNGNYDYIMHRFGPESHEAIAELRYNARTFAMIDEMLQTHWKKHNTLLGFAMDHGCHEIDGSCGSHGLDMDEDLHILHSYKIIPAEK